MQYRTLGRSELRVSEVGLGSWAFESGAYGDVPASDSIRTVETALKAGVTFFDSAPLYGNRDRDGISEEIFGEGLTGRRDEVILSSKFGRNATEGAAPRFDAGRAFESVESTCAD